jgi:hypothetical protein
MRKCQLLLRVGPTEPGACTYRRVRSCLARSKVVSSAARALTKGAEGSRERKLGSWTAGRRCLNGYFE